MKRINVSQFFSTYYLICKCTLIIHYYIFYPLAVASEALIYDRFFSVELCQSSDHMSKLGLYESVKAVIVCQSSECILK